MNKGINFFVLIIIIMLTSIPFIYADWKFNNVKSELIKGDGISEYGKIEIDDWYGLKKLMSLELKTNTEICSSTNCSAKQEIIMYEDGKLIDDFRFIDLETGLETSIESYDIYVNGNKYNYEEVSGYSNGVKYNVELKGKLYPFQKVDWQIRSAGTDWIEDWAVWTDSLTNGTMAFWKFDESAGTTVEDSTGNYELATNGSWITTGLINNANNFTTATWAYNESFMDMNMTDFSISFWFKLDQTWDTTQATFDVLTERIDQWVVSYFTIQLNPTNGKLVVQVEGENQGEVAVYSNVTNWTTGRWYHVAYVWDGRSNSTLYIDGEFNHTKSNPGALNTTTLHNDFSIGGSFYSGNFNGSIDEYGFWNRSLSQAEVQTLYNSGSGISYQQVLITLNAPVDDYNSTNSNVTFNCTALAGSALNITNISLYHNDTTWALNQTNSTTRENNSTAIFYVDFQNYKSIEWNCYACANNSECDWGTNKTIHLKNFVINSETYNSIAYETTTETIEINISYFSPTYNSISAILNYNGTEYIGEESGSGNDLSFSRTLDIPLLTGASAQNKSFNWTFTLTNASGTYYTYSSPHNQTINPIILGECGGALGNITLNFTAWDEEELTRINGFDFKATFFYWLGSGTYMKNVSFNNKSIYEENLCIDPGDVSYYLINSDIEYTSNFTGYVTRNYYFENDTINNVTKHIFLYLLNLSDSTSFILKVVDQNQQAVEDAIIYTQRYFPGTGEYRIVQIATTDENGKSIGFFKTETVDYRFIIEKDGVIELTTSRQKVIPEETPYTLLFTIGAALDKPWADFDDLEDLDYILTFNISTNITTFTYTDTSGNFTQGRLLVLELQYNQTDIVVCNTTSSDSSATLTCDASGKSGTFTAQGLITRNSEEKTISMIQFIITTTVEVIGVLGLFLAFFIILVSGCAFIWHPIAGIVGINSAVIFTNMIGLVSFSPLYIFGMIAISVILIFVLKD